MSPVVLRSGPYIVVIYTKDHLPPHVHVKSADNEARIELDPVRIMDNYGFKPGQIRAILKLIQAHQQKLIARWEEFHS